MTRTAQRLSTCVHSWVVTVDIEDMGFTDRLTSLAMSSSQNAREALEYKSGPIGPILISRGEKSISEHLKWTL